MACRSMPGNRNPSAWPHGLNGGIAGRERHGKCRHRKTRQVRNVPDHIALPPLTAMHLADRGLLDGCLLAARIMQGRTRLDRSRLSWILHRRHRVNREHELRPQQDHRRKSGEAKLQAVASERFHSQLSLKARRTAALL